MSVNQVMQQFRTLVRLIPKSYLSVYRNKPKEITKKGRYIYDNSANTISKIKYNGAVIIETQKGNDQINAYNGGKDSVYAIYADAGKDTVNVYGGDAAVDAGSGNDAVYLRKGNNRVVIGGKGDDSFKISAGFGHMISAGAGNDTLYLEKGTKNSVVYTGDAGKDTINVSAGSYHILAGGSGNDKIYLKNGTGKELTVEAGTGNDVIKVDAGSKHVIMSGSGNDDVTVTKGNNHTIYTGSGKDTVTLSGGKMSTVYLEQGTNKVNTSASTTVLIQKNATSVDTIKVDWQSNVGTTVIDTVKKEGDNKDWLIIENAKSSDFIFKYGSEEKMLVVYAESDSSKAIGINDWFWNDAFSKITFTADNVTFSFDQVLDKSIWV